MKTINPFEVLKKSMKDNLNISDVIIRYIAIENYFGVDNNGFEIYSIMQSTRVKNNKNVPKYRDDGGKRFKELIKSVDENGYMNEYPIIFNQDGFLFDGVHRLALALYYGVEKISYEIDERIELTPDYSLNWFESYGLGHLKPLIISKYQEILSMEDKNV